jgi:hypothetical protein
MKAIDILCAFLSIWHCASSIDTKEEVFSLMGLENITEVHSWLIIVIEDPEKVRVEPSRGFLTTIRKDGKTAVAIGVGGNQSKRKRIISPALTDKFNKFRFPIETKPTGFLSKGIACKESPADISKHFRHSVSPLDDMVEFVTLVTECKSPVALFSIHVFGDIQWTKIQNLDSCLNKIVIIVPRGDFDEPSFLELPMEYQGVSGHLDLALAADATEGSLIRLENFENRLHQRWTFVNNTMRNVYGMCLTAWSPMSTYLYQYECRPQWVGQIWIRYGSQIINGFRQCLTLNPEKLLAKQDNCDSTPEFLWKEWTAFDWFTVNEKKELGLTTIEADV